MISEVWIRNFKSLRDVRIGLERFTIFVGPNASGKSSVLQAMHAVCRNFIQGNINANEDVEIRQAQSRDAKEPVELSAKSQGQWFRYRMPIAINTNFPGGFPGGFGGQTPGLSFRVAGPTPEGNDLKVWQPKAASDLLPQSVILQLEASKLIPPSVNNQGNQGNQTTMAPDGTGIHFALSSMALNEPDTWQELQADLRSIIPTVRRLRHSKVPHGQIAQLLFDTVGADSLTANQVSEGTLLVLGMLAGLYAPDRPNLILLDDLDRGLHPKAQKDLIALLRKLLDRNPNLQIAATTHSPYMLDCMEPEEVRMTCLDESGATVCDSIEKHPKFEKWKDEMAPGELWSLFGEKWLLERKVAA